MQNSIYKIKYLLFLSWDWEAWCLTQSGGVIPPPERNTAWNKGRKCFHCLGAPNNLIRPCAQAMTVWTAAGCVLRCGCFRMRLEIWVLHKKNAETWVNGIRETWSKEKETNAATHVLVSERLESELCSVAKPFKYKAQTALFKDPVRTAL